MRPKPAYSQLSTMSLVCHTAGTDLLWGQESEFWSLFLEKPILADYIQ